MAHSITDRELRRMKRDEVRDRQELERERNIGRLRIEMELKEKELRKFQRQRSQLLDTCRQQDSDRRDLGPDLRDDPVQNRTADQHILDNRSAISDVGTIHEYLQENTRNRIRDLELAEMEGHPQSSAVNIEQIKEDSALSLKQELEFWTSYVRDNYTTHEPIPAGALFTPQPSVTQSKIHTYRPSTEEHGCRAREPAQNVEAEIEKVRIERDEIMSHHSLCESVSQKIGKYKYDEERRRHLMAENEKRLRFEIEEKRKAEAQLLESMKEMEAKEQQLNRRIVENEMKEKELMQYSRKSEEMSKRLQLLREKEKCLKERMELRAEEKLMSFRKEPTEFLEPHITPYQAEMNTDYKSPDPYKEPDTYGEPYSYKSPNVYKEPDQYREPDRFRALDGKQVSGQERARMSQYDVFLDYRGGHDITYKLEPYTIGYKKEEPLTYPKRSIENKKELKEIERGFRDNPPPDEKNLKETRTDLGVAPPSREKHDESDFPQFKMGFPRVPNFNGKQFEQWKMEVNCLIRSRIYPDYAIATAVRNSLKDETREILLTLKPTATTLDILRKVEEAYGNIKTGDNIVHEFYSATQKDKETVSAWGIRLETLYQQAIDRSELDESKRDRKLKERFWRGLVSDKLKIATRVSYESDDSFEKLRMKARREEGEFGKEKQSGDKAIKQANVNQHVNDEKDNILEELLKKMKRLETEFRNLKQQKSDGYSGSYRGRNRGYRVRYNYGHQQGQQQNAQQARNTENKENKTKEPLN